MMTLCDRDREFLAAALAELDRHVPAGPAIERIPDVAAVRAHPPDWSTALGLLTWVGLPIVCLALWTLALVSLYAWARWLGGRVW